jgi:hypothetical protein
MAIRVDHAEPVRASAEKAFALIDDLPRTREWLPPCVSLTKQSPGPNAVGDTLRYVYKNGRSQAEMPGSIVAREAGRRLCAKYGDKMFDVVVDLLVEHGDASSCVTRHIIEITPKTLFGRLLTPVIRLGLRKQTRDAAANLRKILEAA